MKESFFYKKNVLITSIRTPKEYPYVQIYAALTQLIEDNNEFIVDKYGRNGRLINIDDYYLFQPIELKDKHISIFDRSVPLDYKHSMINFELNQNIIKPVIDKRNIDIVDVVDVVDVTNNKNNRHENHLGKKVLDELQVNYDITNEFSKLAKVPRADDNWYKHCGIVMKKMTKEYPESAKYLIIFLVAHMIESLLYHDKLNLMNYLYSLDKITKNSLEDIAKQYFDKISIVTKDLRAIVMYNIGKRVIVILDDNNKWIEAGPEDQREIATSKEAKTELTFDVKEYNKIIGFIGYERNNKFLVFKTKDMSSSRDTGARCNQAGKDKTMKKLNDIIGENRYTNETTKAKKDTDGNVISQAIGDSQLCVIQEFILRYFNVTKKDDKKWFLTPEQAIYFKLYKVFV